MPEEEKRSSDLRQQMLPIGVVFSILLAVGGMLWSVYSDKTALEAQVNRDHIERVEKSLRAHEVLPVHPGMQAVAREITQERVGSLSVQMSQLERLLTQRLDNIDKRLATLEDRTNNARRSP